MHASTTHVCAAIDGSAEALPMRPCPPQSRDMELVSDLRPAAIRDLGALGWLGVRHPNGGGGGGGGGGGYRWGDEWEGSW